MKKLLGTIAVLMALAIIAFLLVWFARPQDVDFDEGRASVPNSQYSHFAEIDRMRIHYQEKGEGMPLVLIHGFSSSTYSWKDVFGPLSEQYRVIAVDLKGFGFSSKPDGDYTRRTQGEIVVKLLDHLKIDKAVLCGNSMGGEVSMNIALHHPERVSGLILIDSGGVKVAGSGSLAPNATQWPVIGPAIAALALTRDSLVRKGLQTSYYDDSKIDDTRVAAYYRPLRTRDGQRAVYLARKQFAEGPIEAEIPQIQQPTLIIWGNQDELIPVEAGRKLNALIKQSRLVILNKCGHVPQEEMPQSVIAEITSFMSSINRPAPAQAAVSGK